MEYKVFGNPITEETLKGLPEYANKTIITQADKAQVALNKKNTMEAQVQEYMETLRKRVPKSMIYTFGKIYNATGNTVTFYTQHDYSGTGKFPEEIKNGELVVFIHVGTKIMDITCGKNSESRGAVVYSGTNKTGCNCDWMLSWSNPITSPNPNPITSDDNKVYTEVAEHGHYPPNPADPIWNCIQKKLYQSGKISKYIWNCCESYMISNRICSSAVSVEAIMMVK